MEMNYWPCQNIDLQLCDAWQIGMLLYSVYTGSELEFTDIQRIGFAQPLDKQPTLVIYLENEEEIDNAICEIIRGLLVTDPVKRMTVQAALAAFKERDKTKRE
jgi:hypothetical protein